MSTSISLTISEERDTKNSKFLRFEKAENFEPNVQRLNEEVPGAGEAVLPDDVCEPFFGSGFADLDATLGIYHECRGALYEINLANRRVTKVTGFECNGRSIIVTVCLEGLGGRLYVVQHHRFLAEDATRSDRLDLLRQFIRKAYPDSLRGRVPHSIRPWGKAFKYCIDCILCDNPKTIPVPMKDGPYRRVP
jgi:hypothetical protein